jgi:hypothetical protein
MQNRASATLAEPHLEHCRAPRITTFSRARREV